jgi:hypothetical protein
VVYSGLVFTRPGVKNLIVEVKRPGALAWIERSAAQSIDAHCIQNWKIWRDVRGVSMAPTLANIRRYTCLRAFSAPNSAHAMWRTE